MVRYDRTGPHLESLDNLNAESKALNIDVPNSAAGAAAKPRPAWLFTTVVRSFRVSLDSLSVKTPKRSFKGRFLASLNPTLALPISVDADVIVRGSAAPRRFKASLTANTDLFRGAPPTYLNARLSAVYARTFRARANVLVRRSPGDRRLSGTGAFDFTSSTGPLRSARLSACKGSSSSASGGLSCRFELLPILPPDERFGPFRNPTGTLLLTASSSGKSSFTSTLSATFDPFKSWYELSGGAKLSASGRRDRPFSELSLRHEVHAVVRARFEGLVAFLRETPYAVPAPIHVLTGPLTLSLDAGGDPRADAQSARYTLSTGLSGPRQRLITSASGVLSASRAKSRSIEHEGELVLKEVALELPRLEVGRAPKIVLDRRISSGEEEPVKASDSVSVSSAPVPYDVRSRLVIRTEKPILFFSNLAKEPVPASLSLASTSPPFAARGTAAFGKFDIELFRRTASVDHVNVFLSSSTSASPLEGLVLYKAPGALISIRILGTTERPRIELSSEPPLKREDIIALLIFGKSPDELDPDQTASVSNTETALESRAFGLASLYLFGATPIEHVGYDPATRTTTVKLRLPGGANLTLGSDFEQNRQLTLRKPLAPHWALQSEVGGAQGGQSRAATTFLEWFNRY